MISFILRHKIGLTFILIIMLLLSFIAGQVPASGGQTILAWGIYAVVSPFQSAAASLVIGIRSLWEGYIDLRNVRIENEILKNEVESIYQENRELSRRLKIAEGFAAVEGERRRFEEEGESAGGTTDYRTLSAMVIGAGVDQTSRALILNRGTLDGVSENNGILCHSGAVGRVIRAGPSTSLVQLIIDPGFAMAARLEKNRVRGILHGAGEECELLYIRNTDAVEVGDTVVASGLEGIFPSEIPVGLVSRLEKGDPPFRRVYVRPFTDFRSLEWVYIVRLHRSLAEREAPQ
jgi:rod shape-determining protein MreC